MSRQFDDYMAGKFEIYDELYELVEPQNFEELLKAIDVRDTIQNYISGLMHDDESASGYLDLLQEQEDYINGYLESLGEFDNSILISNINYLTKKSNLRIGDIEKMLGISAGYISRTAKENSQKKLSIDVVWKIAKLFEVNIKILLEQNLSIPSDTTDMLIRFMAKLYRKTKAGELDWSNHGGSMYELEQQYLDLKLFSIDDVEADNGHEYYRYHPNHLNQNLYWELVDDIVACERFAGEKTLAIIPFRLENEDKNVRYDFIFVWKEKNKWKWEKVFYTADDAFGNLTDYADSLYELIHGLEFNASVTPDIRNMIESYLKD